VTRQLGLCQISGSDFSYEPCLDKLASLSSGLIVSYARGWPSYLLSATGIAPYLRSRLGTGTNGPVETNRSVQDLRARR
jgi:hypothetical protein